MISQTAGELSAEPSHHDRVQSWSAALERVESLSPRYRNRYAIVLAKLEERASPAAVGRARRAVSEGDASRAAAILAGGKAIASTLHVAQEPKISGYGPLLDTVRAVVGAHPDLSAFIASQPPLEHAAVPLHPERQAHLVRYEDEELVALRWPSDSPDVRAGNQTLLTEAIQRASAASPLPIVAHDAYVLVAVGSADPWVFAPHLGRTLEDRLRADDFGPGEREATISTLGELRRSMVSATTIWQGFAPRNMFLHDGKLVLIDFEEAVDAAANPARAAECLLWHRVFFADCLTPAETETLFASLPDEPTAPDEAPLTADAFERALLGVDEVTWKTRRELLEASVALEGRHTRPERLRDDGVLFGHELGHFWGRLRAGRGRGPPVPPPRRPPRARRASCLPRNLRSGHGG